jgi:hypothetical protein
MKKSLSLKTEHLTELTTGDLQSVAGAYTGLPTLCVITLDPRGCISHFCTILDCLATK